MFAVSPSSPRSRAQDLLAAVLACGEGAAISHRTAAVQHGTRVFSASVIFFNLIADVLYGWLDPRISYR